MNKNTILLQETVVKRHAYNCSQAPVLMQSPNKVFASGHNTEHYEYAFLTADYDVVSMIPIDSKPSTMEGREGNQLLSYPVTTNSAALLVWSIS